jgi:hypothetical protein
MERVCIERFEVHVIRQFSPLYRELDSGEDFDLTLFNLTFTH